MKIYYRGNLIENNDTDYSKFTKKYERDAFYISQQTPNGLKLSGSEFDYLKKELDNYRVTYEPINNEHLIKILNKAKAFYSEQCAFSSVIFEIIESEDGKKYGKELLTGLMFPLPVKPQIKYYYGFNEKYDLFLEKTYTDDNVARFRYILTPLSVASINEVENYKSKKDKTNFIRSITYYYKENVFKKQIIEKEIEPLKEQNILTKLMEEIEYLLQLLKQYNIDAYNRLSFEYEKLLKENNDSLVATDPSKKELENFLANVKLTLLVNENKKDSLSEYLTDAAVRYFNRLNSNELSNQDLNINDIDVLTEMFLSNKDNYTAIEQRNILTKFSILYLFITKANINNIEIEDLKESYFSKNLKTIILCIFALCENSIITNPINITSNDNITIEKVIEIIKSIGFNKIESIKIKNLIK